MSIAVRRATLDDLETVRSIGTATYPMHGTFAGSDYVEAGLWKWWSIDAVRRSIVSSTTYLAIDQDAAVGTATVGTLDGEPILWKLYVLPIAQGVGTGSALLSAAIADLPAGSRRLLLEHAEGNDQAATFYLYKGFTELERTEPHSGAGPRDVWMALEL